MERILWELESPSKPPLCLFSMKKFNQVFNWIFRYSLVRVDFSDNNERTGI